MSAQPETATADPASWPVYDVAKHLHAAGWAVLPRRGGQRGKGPALRQWAPFHERKPTRDELWDWFVGGQSPRRALGAVCGRASGGLWVCDIEGSLTVDNPDRFAAVLVEAQRLGVADVIAEVRRTAAARTPSGGEHWFFRITDADAPGSTKLASTHDPDHAKADERGMLGLAETKGQGGFIALPPESGREWVGDPGAVVDITLEQADLIAEALRAAGDPADEPRADSTGKTSRSSAGTTADVLAANVAGGALPPLAILPDGYRLVGRPDAKGRQSFVRPGASSATSGHVVIGDHPHAGTFRIWSSGVSWADTSAGGVTMTAAAVLAAARYDGDHAAAMRAVESAAAALLDDGVAPEAPFDSWPDEVLEQVHAARAQARAQWRGERVRTFDARKGSTGDGPNPAAALNGVWDERPWLAHLRAAAYARGVSAPAVLAAFLARYCAEIDPRHVLPPIVGGHVSLNLYVALLGRAGAGKSSTLAVVEELAKWGTLSPGVASGEGLLRGYGAYDRGAGKWVQRDTAMAVQVDEVASLTPQTERGGSTLLGLLNSAWMGSKLSQPYADPTKRAEMAAHAYRLSVIVGVQVGKADGLLQHADAGTPQRFLWAPLVDPSIPRRRDRPEWPGRLELPRPALVVVAT